MTRYFEKPTNAVNAIPSYAPGTPARQELLDALARVKAAPVKVPLIINGREVTPDDRVPVPCPHDHNLVLAEAAVASRDDLEAAVDSALAAHEAWATMAWYQRAAIFQKAADLLAGPRRTRILAAIMLNQSKNPYEAEIDLAELVDFWRFNIYFAQEIYARQPGQHPGETNRFDWRPLEGFVVAIPPFNFFSIGGNLPTAPALVGNVVLWKPATSVILANYQIMRLLVDAGLPPGVVNFVPFPHAAGQFLFEHERFAGLHFTGSYDTLVTLWQAIGARVPAYRNFPRIVGETGGKDFIFVHPSAVPRHAALNILRGAFGYQGQKCSACSRVYVAASVWPAIKAILLEELPAVTYGAVESLEVHMGALITRKAYQKVVAYIELARTHPDEYEFIHGGAYDDARGWFVEPTVIRARQPRAQLLQEEIFGPVVTVYVYEDAAYEETLRVCGQTSPYGLTGAIFATDRAAIARAERVLRYSAGNFYINDKPTGAIVNRQPFGGARASGTNDKAGSELNLLRWLSPRVIKETTAEIDDWRRPFMR